MATESTTAISRRRRPRGRYPKTQDGATPKRQKRIPEYLEADEVNAIIRAAPNPKAKLLMLEHWRAGLLLRAVAGRNASRYPDLQRLYRQAPCAGAIEDPLRRMTTGLLE